MTGFRILPSKRVCPNVEKKLLKVLEGKVDALDLLFAGELATEYYKETEDSYECLKMVEPYLDALAHKHPSLTSPPDSFEKVKEKFRNHVDRMVFATLNMEQDPFQQGFQTGEDNLITRDVDFKHYATKDPQTRD